MGSEGRVSSFVPSTVGGLARAPGGLRKCAGFRLPTTITSISLFMVFRNIGLFARRGDARIDHTVHTLRAHLAARGVSLVPGETPFVDLFDGGIAEAVETMHDGLDLGVAIGGDGTMLHLARHFARTRVPLIGVNLGRLGFLTDISAEQMREEFDEILDGRYYVEHRILLDARIYDEDGRQIAEGMALNDAVLTKGETGRMIEYSWWVNDEMVGTTRGDGVIVTTPTGSTAYALSAGGPILHPVLPAISVVPVCPHTVSHRPIVLDDSSVIKIKVNDLAGAGGHLFLDGLAVTRLEGNETIVIGKSEGQSLLVRAARHNHFEALRSKLGWAG